jgi:hypothetical protein
MSRRPKPVAPSRSFRAGDEFEEAHCLSVNGNREPLIEADRQLDRLVRTHSGQRVRLLRRCSPRILDFATLDRSAPEVFVDRIDLVLARGDGIDHLAA